MGMVLRVDVNKKLMAARSLREKTTAINPEDLEKHRKVHFFFERQLDCWVLRVPS